MNPDLEDIKSRALYQQGGPNPAQVLIHESDFNYLLVEVARLRKDCEHHKQAALDISEENDRLVQDMADQEDAAATWDQVESILDGFTVDPPRPGAKRVQDLFDVINRLQNENAFQNQRMQELFKKAEHLEKLVPPESERGPGFVGQGSWSVFAEKVVAERDEAQEEVRFLTKKNKELEAQIRKLGEELAAKKEKANLHYELAEFTGIDGYGPFSLKKICKDRWEIRLLNEKVVLYNRKGHRVRGDVDNNNHNYDGDW